MALSFFLPAYNPNEKVNLGEPAKKKRETNTHSGIKPCSRDIWRAILELIPVPALCGLQC